MIDTHLLRPSPSPTGYATLMLLLAANALAEAPIICPDLLAVEQSLDAPEGWQQRLYQDSVPLAEALLHNGRPEEGITMMADEETSEGGEWLQRWQLAENPRGYWLVCRYHGSVVELSIQLPDNVESCELAYDRGARFASGSLPRRASCR